VQSFEELDPEKFPKFPNSDNDLTKK